MSLTAGFKFDCRVENPIVIGDLSRQSESIDKAGADARANIGKDRHLGILPRDAFEYAMTGIQLTRRLVRGECWGRC